MNHAISLRASRRTGVECRAEIHGFYARANLLDFAPPCAKISSKPSSGRAVLISVRDAGPPRSYTAGDTPPLTGQHRRQPNEPGGKSEKRTERERRLRPETNSSQAEAGSGAQPRERREQHHLRQRSHPNPRPRRRQQLGVALAQALSPAQGAIEKANRAQAEIAGGGAKGAIGQPLGVERHGGGQPGYNERQGQRVGQKPAAEIDPTECEQPPAEYAVEPRSRPAIDPHRDQRNRQRGELDPGIEPAERAPAEAAATRGREPAEQRHEVADRKGGAALLAKRPRQGNRPAVGQPLDDDAKK